MYFTKRAFLYTATLVTSITSNAVIPAKAGIHEKTGFPRVKHGAGSVKPCTVLVQGKPGMTRGVRLMRSCTTSFAVITTLIALTYLIPGCDYARMKDQESIRTYEAEPPEMPQGTIPISGGSEVLKASKPEDLHNPLSDTLEILEKGRMAYSYFCIMCHGPNLDGSGTVGQSFAPLPTNLKSPYVQQQSDGLLFYRISFGYKRHPPLGSTVSQKDRWAVIRYLKSLRREKG